MDLRHACSVLLLASTGAWAAGGAVPPVPGNEAAEGNEKATAALKEGIPGASSALMQGAAMVNHASGQPGSNAMLSNAKALGDGLKRGVQAASLVEAGMKDGVSGVMREGTQITINEAIEKGAGLATHALAEKAVESGVSATAASGGVGIAFTAGTLVGGYIRDNTAFGKSFNDAANNLYFKMTPDIAKEWASGVKQVDETSPEWSASLDADVQARIRQNAFRKVAAENEEQERERQAYEAQTAGEASSSSDLAATADALAILGDTLSSYNRQRAPMSLGNSSTSSAAARSCPIDPKTGCHFGHNEKTHPGGCKAC